MSEDLMLKCLIGFILGWLASRMMGNGFRVGDKFTEAGIWKCKCTKDSGNAMDCAPIDPITGPWDPNYNDSLDSRG